MKVGVNKYKNKFEIVTGEFLTKKKLKFEYETEKLEYTITSNYIPDFIVTTKSGKKIYIETKGNGRSWDGAARRKLVAVKKQHPDLDIRLVFWSDGKFGASRKDGTRQTQSSWAEKNGFPWAIREIPNAWLQ
jgi:hypothetical protein